MTNFFARLAHPVFGSSATAGSTKAPSRSSKNQVSPSLPPTHYKQQKQQQQPQPQQEHFQAVVPEWQPLPSPSVRGRKQRSGSLPTSGPLLPPLPPCPVERYQMQMKPLPPLPSLPSSIPEYQDLSTSEQARLHSNTLLNSLRRNSEQDQRHSLLLDQKDEHDHDSEVPVDEGYYSWNTSVSSPIGEALDRGDENYLANFDASTNFTSESIIQDIAHGDSSIPEHFIGMPTLPQDDYMFTSDGVTLTQWDQPTNWQLSNEPVLDSVLSVGYPYPNPCPLSINPAQSYFDQGTMNPSMDMLTMGEDSGLMLDMHQFYGADSNQIMTAGGQVDPAQIFAPPTSEFGHVSDVDGSRADGIDMEFRMLDMTLDAIEYSSPLSHGISTDDMIMSPTDLIYDDFSATTSGLGDRDRVFSSAEDSYVHVSPEPFHAHSAGAASEEDLFVSSPKDPLAHEASPAAPSAVPARLRTGLRRTISRPLVSESKLLHQETARNSISNSSVPQLQHADLQGERPDLDENIESMTQPAHSVHDGVPEINSSSPSSKPTSPKRWTGHAPALRRKPGFECAPRYNTISAGPTFDERDSAPSPRSLPTFRATNSVGGADTSSSEGPSPRKKTSNSSLSTVSSFGETSTVTSEIDPDEWLDGTACSDTKTVYLFVNEALSNKLGGGPPQQNRQRRTSDAPMMSPATDDTIDITTDVPTESHPNGFKCVCGRVFAKLHNMKYHYQKVHQKEKPYVCDVCQRGFARKHDLKRHATTLLCRGEGRTANPFECDKCDTSFTRLDALHRHIKAKRCKAL
ncbi:hypothetical protein HKX48_007891 [Thoreauomyces humboldtii]|nr:hypothetical protein HKX48_007891 [Thoreauomyces humboldtii]